MQVISRLPKRRGASNGDKLETVTVLTGQSEAIFALPYASHPALSLNRNLNSEFSRSYLKLLILPWRFRKAGKGVMLWRSRDPRATFHNRLTVTKREHFFKSACSSRSWWLVFTIKLKFDWVRIIRDSLTDDCLRFKKMKSWRSLSFIAKHGRVKDVFQAWDFKLLVWHKRICIRTAQYEYISNVIQLSHFIKKKYDNSYIHYW